MADDKLSKQQAVTLAILNGKLEIIDTRLSKIEKVMEANGLKVKVAVLRTKLNILYGISFVTVAAIIKQIIFG